MQPRAPEKESQENRPSVGIVLDGSVAPAQAASALRAWCYLVWFCIQRQARARQMVWIALALLGLSATVIALNTMADRWSMASWGWVWRPPSVFPATPPAEGPPRPPPAPVVLTYRQTAAAAELLPHVAPWPPVASGLQTTLSTASQTLLRRSGFFVFSNWVVFSVFVGFLLPIWSLSFATEALGGEREGRSLVWLLTRPLPRSSIYLAKFVGLLPWSLGFNVAGFCLLCVLAGQPGSLAFRLYWPAVLVATLAFSALFHLMSACFQRSAVVALVYSFFLETILGTMPGHMKRISVSFYTRCLMFDAARDYGVQAEKPSVYLPVDSVTAWCVLVGATVIFLLLGMAVFARVEYQDLA
jgi:hypothetical protein